MTEILLVAPILLRMNTKLQLYKGFRLPCLFFRIVMDLINCTYTHKTIGTYSEQSLDTNVPTFHQPQHNILTINNLISKLSLSAQCQSLYAP